MWIWYVDKSEGGNLDAIAARAQAAGDEHRLRQERRRRRRLGAVHAAARRRPARPRAARLRLAVRLRRRPAGRGGARPPRRSPRAPTASSSTPRRSTRAATPRPSATSRALRGAIGPSYPLGFTSFPYVDYHPRLPYSVFLGPGGAQANLPQVYWKAIGGSVDAVSAQDRRATTASTARRSRRSASPTTRPTADDLRRFRALWAGYGAAGLSWWSWQATGDAAWAILTEPAPAPVVPPDPGWPALDQGSTRRPGDLAAAAPRRRPTRRSRSTAKFTAATKAALQAFQTVARPGADGRDRRRDVAGAADACRCASWTGPRSVASRRCRGERSSVRAVRKTHLRRTRSGRVVPVRGWGASRTFVATFATTPRVGSRVRLRPRARGDADHLPQRCRSPALNPTPGVAPPAPPRQQPARHQQQHPARDLQPQRRARARPRVLVGQRLRQPPRPARVRQVDGQRDRPARPRRARRAPAPPPAPPPRSPSSVSATREQRDDEQRVAVVLAAGRIALDDLQRADGDLEDGRELGRDEQRRRRRSRAPRRAAGGSRKPRVGQGPFAIVARSFPGPMCSSAAAPGRSAHHDGFLDHIARRA